MAKVFEEIQVYPLCEGGSHLRWSLHPLFELVSPATFFVQYSDSLPRGEAEWRTIARLPSPVQLDDGSYTVRDPERRFRALIAGGVYRVLIQDANGQLFGSPTCSAFGGFTGQDRRDVEYIWRGELLRMRKMGEQGFLLRRRYQGVRCPECADWDTQVPTKGVCLTCYGTGFSGGYYRPIPYNFLTEEHTAIIAKLTQDSGVLAPHSGVFRSLPIPEPAPRDILVDGSDSRWLLESVDSTAHLRGQSVILGLKAVKLPMSHAIYKYSLNKLP